MLSIPSVQLSRDEFEILGSASLASHALDIIAHLQGMVQGFVHLSTRVEPRAEYYAFYRPLDHPYAAIFSTILCLIHSLAEVPSPPGNSV